MSRNSITYNQFTFIFVVRNKSHFDSNGKTIQVSMTLNEKTNQITIPILGDNHGELQEWNMRWWTREGSLLYRAKTLKIRMECFNKKLSILASDLIYTISTSANTRKIKPNSLSLSSHPP